MEIEKKYRIKKLPEAYEDFPYKEIEQGYLCKDPIIRIRKSNENYILTYKSKYGIDPNISQTCVANEVEVQLSREGYMHLKEKIDHHMVYKTRYLIPLNKGLTAELDIFKKYLDGLMIVEVEFPSINAASKFHPPDWFGEEVSSDYRYKNAYLSTIDNIREL